MTKINTLPVAAIFAALILSAPMTSLGCEGKNKHMTKRVDYVGEKLALNDEQRAQFTQMLMDLREERRNAMQAILKEKKAAFQGMLTAEQKRKLAAEHPEFNPFKKPGHSRKGKRGHHGKERRS